MRSDKWTSKNSKKIKKIDNVLKRKNIGFRNIDQKNYQKYVQVRLITLKSPPELLATFSKLTHQKSTLLFGQKEKVNIGLGDRITC